MTAGKPTESRFKIPKMHPMLLDCKPVTLTGWRLYQKLYLRSVYDKVPGCVPVDVSYHSGLAAEEWKSMTDLDKANFEASVPPQDRVHYEPRENIRNAAAQNEKVVRKMDLADKMEGLRM